MNPDDRDAKFNALAIGWYGAPNIGDEVLLEILRKQVQSLGGVLAAASIDPQLTRDMHGIDAVDYNNLGEIARALTWADVLIMGGGGIFQDHHPFTIGGLYDPLLNDISAYARPVFMARQFGVPVVIWGQGVGPLRGVGARQIVRDIFKGAASASVRDVHSLELLREIGVDREISVGPDPGWLYSDICRDNEPRRCTVHNDTKRLVIVVREWSLGAIAWKERLIAAINQTVTAEWSVSWVGFQSQTARSGATSDLHLLDELRQKVRAECAGEIFAPNSPKEAWDIIGSADAIFSMRLHASMLGLLAGRPVAGLEYDEKMRSAHDLAGMPETHRLSLEDSQARFDSTLRCLLEEGAWRPDPARIERLKERAGIHRGVLAAVAMPKMERPGWEVGKFDWLGTWLQQALTDLRRARNVSERAHSLLEFRDSTLSQLEAEMVVKIRRIEELCNELKHVQELFEYRSDQFSALEQAHAARARELAEAQGLMELQRSQLSQAAELVEELNSQVMKERSLGDQLRSEQRQASEELAALSKRLREEELSRLELLDELHRKVAYIEDKEIHVAQLSSQLTQQGAQLEYALRELEKSGEASLLTKMFLRMARGTFRIAAFPSKFLMLWHRHGLRVAIEQARYRLRSPRRTQQVEIQQSESYLFAPPRPVRDERLLVIAGSLDVEGWRSRALALTKGADRAGFLSRIWCGEGHVGESVITGASPLLVESDEFLQLVTIKGTRVFLANHSDSALELAAAAKDRGAEIILDLSSLPMNTLGSVRLQSMVDLSSRVISREDRIDSRFDQFEVEYEQLLDAGDNEAFDSYKNYPFPKDYSKHRRNLFLYVEDVDCGVVVDQLVAAFPHDIIHVMAASSDSLRVTQSSAVRIVKPAADDLPSFIRGADVVFIHGLSAESYTMRSVAVAALLMERCVIAGVMIKGLISKNFHFLEPSSWDESVLSISAVEDYEFVSRNTWLLRAEQLMRGKFPHSVSVIVLIHNNRGIIERCVSTILDHCGEWIREIVIVDNQSADGGAELVEQRFKNEPKVKLVRNTENGCSSGRNLGVKSSSGRYVAFFDSDQWLTAPSCFAEAVHLLESEPTIGALGWNAGWFDARRDDLGGAISDYVPSRGMNSRALARGYRADIGFLGTSGLFMSRELFDRIEGFDTFYDPTCFEDTDICFQIKSAGFEVALRDLAGIRHQPHQTTGASEGSERYRNLFSRNAAYFRRKWSSHPEYFVDYSS